jgi:glycosyltransferase involved in cell wall biosynthesis
MDGEFLSQGDGAAQAHISVAMCTFNGARYLGEQLASIAAQTLLPDELIVCDDRSSDETLTILENFARSSMFPVRLFVNDENLGPAKNFEQALRLCRGELIAFSDQDDIWYPRKLAQLVGILDQDATLGGVFSDGTLMDESSNRVNGQLWERVHYHPPSHSLHVEQSLANCLLKRNVVTGATLMIRASMQNLALPVPDPWMHDGWIAWMLLLHSGIAAAPEPLIAYRIHGAQHAGLSRGSVLERIEYARQVRRRECLPTASQFEALRAHLAQHPGCHREELQVRVQEKIAHLRRRVNLPRSLFPRMCRILAGWRQYQLYSGGLATMLKDLLIP